jgi:hypothetical protein
MGYIPEGDADFWLGQFQTNFSDKLMAESEDYLSTNGLVGVGADNSSVLRLAVRVGLD